MKVKEIADLTGISVRTLHHYDAIGLLKPERVNAAGYRSYSSENLTLLQQILFFRELGFSLAQIKAIVTDPGFDPLQALQAHRQRLLAKRQQLDTLLETVAHTIQNLKGERTMTDPEKFKGFDFSHNPYEAEARQRWGDAEVNASKARLKHVQQAGQMAALQEEMNSLYRDLATLRQQDPASAEAQAAIARWYQLLQRMGNYSYAAFKGLGQMYVDDSRFTANIDQFGEGLAVFMRDAMAIYADRQTEAEASKG